MHCIFLTLYPDMFPGPLGFGVCGQAYKRDVWRCTALNIRDFATDKHKRVDDTPYGGGAGMVMKADVLARAIDAAYALEPDAQLLMPSPRGEVFMQQHSVALSQRAALIFICGRFEAIDERIIAAYSPLQYSLGDYIVCGGEVAAMAMTEAALRHLPGVLGNEETHAEESFAIGKDCAGLLEYPHYTKPPNWNGMTVPEVLMSGNHRHINTWRVEQAEMLTQAHRQDLWQAYVKTHKE